MPRPAHPTSPRPNSSMQLTRAADYAVRVMVHLAAVPGAERLSLPQLGRAVDVPDSFLSKILQALGRAGLITSLRGPAGGFAITPAGARATMRTVIEAVDGPIRLNRCLGGGAVCPRQAWCPAHPVWVQAQRAMLAVLQSATVAAMARDAQTARQQPCLCGIEPAAR